MLQNENYTLLCDFYELTMANGYFLSGKGNEIAYFDVFFRKIPDGGGFAIVFRFVHPVCLKILIFIPKADLLTKLPASIIWHGFLKSQTVREMTFIRSSEKELQKRMRKKSMTIWFALNISNALVITAQKAVNIMLNIIRSSSRVNIPNSLNATISLLMNIPDVV